MGSNRKKVDRLREHAPADDTEEVRRPTVRARLEEVLEARSVDSAGSYEFPTDDPLGLVRDIEASGQFHRDSGLGRIFHPGRISFREKKPVEALHILIDDNRVSAHIDKHSPLRFTESKRRYSLPRVVLHNLSGIGEDIMGLATGRWRRNRWELECEPVSSDGRLLDDYLQRPRSVEFVTDVGPGTGEAPEAGDGSAGRAPFSVIDEAVHLLDTDAAPWSIQLEARVEGSLDEARLRQAIQEALTRHSMTRARKVASPRTKHQDMWEIDPRPVIDPLKVVECAGDGALNSLRSELQSIAVPLTESPPLRARLAKTPGGDVLMLNLNHAATDGFGALRILRSIARAYAGEPDPVARIDFLAARNLPERLAAANLSTRMRRYAALAEKLRDVVKPPARLTSESASDEAGYGFHLERLSKTDTRSILEMKRSGTVNDVLVTALHMTIAQWNEARNGACGRIGVLVPANLRPPKWRQQMVGNFSLPARISTGPRDRKSATSALRAVATQTSRKKKSGMGTALIEVMKASARLPLWLKQASVAILPLTGNRLVDTAMLSNLGRLDDPPYFGSSAGPTTELWFSPPARMPLGLAIGASTVNERLHLVFRYRHRLFGPDAAVEFARCYLDQLRKIVEEAPNVLPGNRRPVRMGSLNLIPAD